MSGSARRLLRGYGVLALGAVLSVVGVVAWFRGAPSPSSFGWFMYSPLQGDSHRSLGVLPDGPRLFGRPWRDVVALAVAGTGLAVVAGVVGRRWSGRPGASQA